MNTVAQSLLAHRSIRKYSPKPVSEEMLDLILKCAQAAPNSINGQQISVIVIRDQLKRDRIAEVTGSQAWIAEAPVFLLFVMDYHRAAIATQLQGKELVITESIESIMVGSVDVGIALGTAVAVAESYGLGTVPIGGVRRNPEEIIDIAGLPEYVYPVCGLVIGHPADHPDQKPRIPMTMFRHDEVYHADQEALLQDYDQVVAEYMLKRTQGTSSKTYSETVAGLYSKVYYPKVYGTLQTQGFKNDK